jgi:tRNA threonylcarbamoyladenosine biosynthesis protein TsaE
MQIALSDLPACATDILSHLPRPAQGATVVGLTGELGAGKTTLVQALARQLGITEHITSPTFVIAKTYTTTHQQFKKLVHIDAYRLESTKELEPIRFSEMLGDSDTLIVIEWPEKIESALPPHIFRVTLSVINEEMRECSYAEN